MGFLSSSVSFTRFRIPEETPESLWTEAAERLKRHSFRDIDHTSDERSFGWVSFENMLDPAWTEAPPEKGGYLAFALRLDTRRIAPAVYKKHVLAAMLAAEQEMKEQGRKFLSRDRKKEIREQVRFRLLARSLPVPALFDVVWNTEAGLVYFGSIQSKMLDLFTEHFTKTFDLHLEPMTPFVLAQTMLGPEALARLEEVEAVQFAI